MHRERRSIALVLASWVGLVAASSCSAAIAHGIYAIEPLMGGLFSYGMGLSTNGRFVAGTSVGDLGNQGIYWSPQTGAINATNGYIQGTAQAVTSQGSVVAGTFLGGARAFRWNAPGGIALGGFVDLGPIDSIHGVGMSADGNTLVAARAGQAIRWRNGIGWENLQGLTTAVAITPDASVVVGQSALGPARWTTSGGVESVPLLSGTVEGEALGVSADGGTVIGRMVTDQGLGRAFRWTASGGVQDLGALAGSPANSFTALTCTGDGNVILGTGSGGGVVEAFAWTPWTGMVRLRDWLASQGLDVSGFRPYQANAITPDGQYMTGFGGVDGALTGWYVHIPAPGASGLLGLAGVLACRRRRAHHLA